MGLIFVAIAGAVWRPVAFIWIALGSIFAGEVHHFMSGMILLQINGLSIHSIAGKNMGNGVI